MISHIDIKDFAVIKNLGLDLYPGLNVITGETGAGKSVVIEAISMALGGRADTDYIRHGSGKASIALIIDTDSDQYSVKRDISNGKSLCRINGETVSVSELSSLCKGLADIHGQYDHQSLLNPDNHIVILDLFGGKQSADVKQLVSESYEKYAAASKELMQLKKQLSDSERQKDFLRYEVNEIRSADLKIGEDALLEEDISVMEHSEAIYDSLSSAYGNIAGDDRAAYSLLGEALSDLDSVKDFSSDLKSIHERISNVYYELEDIFHEIRNQKENVSFSEGSLDAAISRLDAINKLKKKYGSTIEEIIEYLDSASNKLDMYENSDEKLSSLEKKILSLKKEYDINAEKLSEIRKKTAERLSADINRELNELNFKSAEFDVRFTGCTPTENGTDIAEFLICTNKGEEKKPLAKIASGGELSRIMLALKRIIGDIDGIPTMIFDEIDTGISGATAAIVGEKLKSISQKHQVICITHLPQIAALGDHHFKISKESDDNETITTVVPLNYEERIEEVARLLSGTEITASARAQAAELLGKK